MYDDGIGARKMQETSSRILVGNLWKYHLSTRNGGFISGFIWENHGNI